MHPRRLVLPQRALRHDDPDHRGLPRAYPLKLGLWPVLYTCRQEGLEAHCECADRALCAIDCLDPAREHRRCDRHHRTSWRWPVNNQVSGIIGTYWDTLSS